MSWFAVGRRVAVAGLLIVAAGCTTGRPGVVGSRPGSAGSASAAAEARFPDPVTSSLPSGTAVKFQSVLDQLVADYQRLRRGGFPASEVAVPGITAAVVSDHGSWMGAAGSGGDGALLAPEAMMPIASITKTFTAAEVLHLAATGKLDLDAPLSTYLRQWPAGDRATVRQALGMRAGLPENNAAFGDLMYAQQAHPHRHWTPQEALARINGTPSTPGGAPAYSNATYWWLGLLVEKVTGQPLATVLWADLIDPAGLSRVAVQDTERPSRPLAAPLARLRLGPSDGYLPCRAMASLAYSAGSFAADARSVALWGYQLYGARVLPADVVHAMITPAAADIVPEVGYGLGTMVFHTVQLGIADSIGHRGGLPGYASMLAVAPERHVSVAVLIDDEGKDVLAIMRKLFTALR